MELAGLEPATSWVRSRRSPKLSYSPAVVPIIDRAVRAPARLAHTDAARAGASDSDFCKGTRAMGTLDDAIREQHLASECDGFARRCEREANAIAVASGFLRSAK